jgi:hypothetical protein
MMQLLSKYQLLPTDRGTYRSRYNARGPNPKDLSVDLMSRRRVTIPAGFSVQASRAEGRPEVLAAERHLLPPGAHCVEIKGNQSMKMEMPKSYRDLHKAAFKGGTRKNKLALNRGPFSDVF